VRKAVRTLSLLERIRGKVRGHRPMAWAAAAAARCRCRSCSNRSGCKLKTGYLIASIKHKCSVVVCALDPSVQGSFEMLPDGRIV
jgi:hypothetical protein